MTATNFEEDVIWREWVGRALRYGIHQKGGAGDERQSKHALSQRTRERPD